MNKTLFGISLASLAIASSIQAYAPSQKVPSELSQNPSFEQGLPASYNTTQYSDGNIERDTSDAAISKQIQAIVSSSEFTQGYQNITFNVSDGIVTLNGHVTRPDNKLTLENRIKNVPGVILINNQISLTGSDNKVIQAPIVE